jgi:cytoskeletal protein CcmA (bactofilin family)
MNLTKNLNLNKPPKTVEQNVNNVSRISQGAAIRGDLSSSTDIRIDGQVDGTLFSEGKVVVGETARLSGKLFATNVDFWGKMDGDIFVKDTLSLKSSAVVNGNIHVRKIQVEMGAQINGSFKMISEQEYEQLVATMVHKSSAPAPKPVRVAAPKPQPEPVKPAPQAS